MEALCRDPSQLINELSLSEIEVLDFREMDKPGHFCGRESISGGNIPGFPVSADDAAFFQIVQAFRFMSADAAFHNNFFL